MKFGIKNSNLPSLDGKTDNDDLVAPLRVARKISIRTRLCQEGNTEFVFQSYGMEQQAHLSLKTKNQQKKRGNIWVRRSTRGPKNVDVNFDECLTATIDEDTVRNTESDLAEKAESKAAVKSKTVDDREHSSLAPTSVIKTENDIKCDNGLSITHKDEKQKENEGVSVDIKEKGKKRKKPRKYPQLEEEINDYAVGAIKRKRGRPRKHLVNQGDEEMDDHNFDEEKERRTQMEGCYPENEANDRLGGIGKKKKIKPKKSSLGEEETDDSLGNIERKKKRKPKKNSQGEPEEFSQGEGTNDCLGDIDIKKGEELQKSSDSKEEIGGCLTDTEKKKKIKGRKSILEEHGSRDYVIHAEKKKGKIGRARKSMQIEQKSVNERVTLWRDSFASKVFKCINAACLQNFITWAGLFDHFHKCEFSDEVNPSVTLPCHVCSKYFPFKPDLVKHIRLQHRDVYDLVHGLESGNATHCFNHKCSAEVKTYEDCIQHGAQCGSLVHCDKCGRSYKTRLYFNSHTCIAEKKYKNEANDHHGGTGKKKKIKPKKSSLGEEETNDSLGDIEIRKGEELQKSSDSEEEMGGCLTDTEKKKKRKGRKSILGEHGSKDYVIHAEKKKGKIGRARKNMEIEQKSVNERVTLWRDSFASKVFKCINAACLQNFITWAGLFDHFHKCEFSDEVKPSVTLPCHVCSKDFPFKPDLVKHIRLQHRDVYDLVHGLESGNATHCFNHKCSAEVKTYEDCIQHGAQCGSLVHCDKCGRSYKTRLYFNSHACIAEKAKMTKMSMKDEFLSSSSEMGKRKAAKRALSAIYSNDSEEAIGSSSKQFEMDDAFEASSGSDEDSAEYEDDDDVDDDDNGDGDDDESKSHISHGSVHDVGTNFTSLINNSQSLDRRRIKPYKRDKNWLTMWYKRNQSSFAFPEWTLSKDDIEFLSESEAAEYFPPRNISPLFNVIYEKQNQHACKTEFKQLGKFEVLHLEGSSITTMFAGGSVSGIEWCPNKGTFDQFLAVTTIGSYAKIAERNKNKELIQIWRVPSQTNPSNTVKLSMMIAVESGPVHCMKWHPSSSLKDNDSDEIERLGILALSCDDGCVRILSVPHPCSLEDQAQERTTVDARIIVKHKTVLILAPNRKNLKMDQSSNKVTCIEWQPNDEQQQQLAAGYLDGTICIWNLKCKSSILRISGDKESCDVLLPFSRINAHSYCVNSLSWCPTDANFIVSVSFEKTLKIFDIREKYASPVISLKRHLFAKCIFLLRMCAISAVEDELSNNLPVGSRFLDLIYQTLAKLSYNPSDHNTAHKATCLGISNSEWMSAIVTCCCGGEVMFCALAHESLRDRSGGKSFRLPVYHIETSDVTASEEGTLKIDNCVTEAMHLSLSDKSPRDASVKEIIRKRAEQLPIKIYKHKFTFRDSNFFEFRNKPRHCAFEVNRIRCFKPNEKSNFSDDEMLQISQVQWNPNYGQHFVLATGGTLGFVRLHHFTNWK